jgi:hypothetical protein
MLVALENSNPLEDDREQQHGQANSSQEVSLLSDQIAGLDLNIFSLKSDTSTTSPACLALAKMWMRNCRDNHGPCNALQPQGALPTRIINVSDPTKPFLEDGLSRREEYLTLSYKWGHSLKYVSTKANLQSHQGAIPLTQLPKTFQDAIQMTHELGFKWLWIDALCILQDCPFDQKYEIGMMSEVFSCSSITLFAVSAEHANDGLSRNRDPRWVKPCKLTIKTTVEGTVQTGTTHVTMGLDTMYGSERPLFSRGWILQEHVLAARRLNFSGMMISWDCLVDRCSETSPQYIRSVAAPRTLDEWRAMERTDFGRIDKGLQFRMSFHGHRESRRFLFDDWYEIIHDYSKRTLSYSMDILPAVAGLAKAMAQLQSLHYVNGLWTKDLATGLLWFVSCSPMSTAEVSKHKDNLPDIPSWSWASQWGKPIEFWKEEILPSKVMCVGHDSSIEATHEADVETAESIADSENNKYQTVTQKTLTVAGHLTTLDLSSTDEYPDMRWAERGRWPLNILEPSTGEILGHIDPDLDPEVTPITSISCLLIEKGDRYFTGLALNATDQKDEYIRVGLVHGYHDVAFDFTAGGVTTTIRII